MARSDRLEVKIYISINSGSRVVKLVPKHGNIVPGEENKLNENRRLASDCVFVSSNSELSYLG